MGTQTLKGPVSHNAQEDTATPQYSQKPGLLFRAQRTSPTTMSVYDARLLGWPATKPALSTTTTRKRNRGMKRNLESFRKRLKAFVMVVMAPYYNHTWRPTPGAQNCPFSARAKTCFQMRLPGFEALLTFATGPGQMRSMREQCLHQQSTMWRVGSMILASILMKPRTV